MEERKIQTQFTAKLIIAIIVGILFRQFLPEGFLPLYNGNAFSCSSASSVVYHPLMILAACYHGHLS